MNEKEIEIQKILQELHVRKNTIDALQETVTMMEIEISENYEKFFELKDKLAELRRKDE